MLNQTAHRLLPLLLALCFTMPMLAPAQDAPAQPHAAKSTTAQDTPAYQPIGLIEGLLHEPPIPGLQLLEQQENSVSTETLIIAADSHPELESVDQTGTATLPAFSAPEEVGAIRDGKVWINDATLDELMLGLTLDYERALSIHDFRRILGPFANVEELKEVFGIDDIKFEGLRAKIVIAPPAALPK